MFFLELEGSAGGGGTNGGAPNLAFLPPGKHTVGRRASSYLCISKDTSVSRTHAELVVTASGHLTVTDKLSKFGTEVNGQRVGAGEEVPLSVADWVRFGQQGSKFFVREKDIVLSHTRLRAKEKIDLQDTACALGIRVSSSWSDQVTHLITCAEGAVATSKFICSLAAGKPVVTLNWLHAIASAKQALTSLPNPLTFTPCFTVSSSVSHDISTQSWRAHALAGTAVLSFAPDAELDAMVTAAGGRVVRLHEESASHLQDPQHSDLWRSFQHAGGQQQILACMSHSFPGDLLLKLRELGVGRTTKDNIIQAILSREASLTVAWDLGGADKAHQHSEWTPPQSEVLSHSDAEVLSHSDAKPIASCPSKPALLPTPANPDPPPTPSRLVCPSPASFSRQWTSARSRTTVGKKGSISDQEKVEQESSDLYANVRPAQTVTEPLIIDSSEREKKANRRGRPNFKVFRKNAVPPQIGRGQHQPFLHDSDFLVVEPVATAKDLELLLEQNRLEEEERQAERLWGESKNEEHPPRAKSKRARGAY